MEQWALAVVGTLVAVLLSIMVNSLSGLKKDVRTLSDKVLERYATKDDLGKCRDNCSKVNDDHEHRLRHVEQECCP